MERYYKLFLMFCRRLLRTRRYTISDSSNEKRLLSSEYYTGVKQSLIRSSLLHIPLQKDDGLLFTESSRLSD